MGSSKGLQPLRSATKTLNALPAAYAGAQVASRRYAGTLANFKIPAVSNEPNVSARPCAALPMCLGLTENTSNTTPKAQ